jgi:Tfp pilus assembly protein PilX
MHAPCTQHGATLAVAMILLVILALLGISAMNVSQQEEQMARQFMAQALVQEQAEACLKSAQADAEQVIDTQLNVMAGSFIAAAGHIDVAGGASEADVGNPDWWDSADNALPCAGGGQYVIEYLGVQASVLPEDRYTGITHTVHAVRLSARGTGASGAYTVLQSLYLRNKV